MTPPSPEAQAEIALFHTRLAELTPRVRVTPTIVAINAVVFIAMVATGVGIMSPSAESVLGWGANFGPRTLGGQPWRLLSNVFVHFGILHIAMNMFALWNAGALIERMYGPLAFAALYLAAGLTGSVASVTVHPDVVSAGASGAVFGVYGALAGFLLRQRGVIPMTVLTQLRGVALSFIAYNILFGFTNKSIDNAAHIGGLLGGAAAGALLVRPLVPGRPAVFGRPVGVVAGALALSALAVVALPKPVDFDKVVDAFSATESSVLGRYNELVRGGGEIDDSRVLEILERDVIPPWRAARQELAAPRRWPARQKRVIDLLLRYADARERGFAAFAEAIRAGDQAAADHSGSHHRIAESVLEEIKALKPE